MPTRKKSIVSDRVVVSAVFQGALDALNSCEDFVHLVSSGRLNLESLALDTADPLIAEIEGFVKAYRKAYGSPVR